MLMVGYGERLEIVFFEFFWEPSPGQGYISIELHMQKIREEIEEKIIIRRNRSLPKLSHVIPLQAYAESDKKETRRTLLPSLHHQQFTHSPSLPLQRRERLQATISLLKERHFGPHGASRAHKLELIRSKRGTETEQSALRALTNLLAHSKTLFPPSKKPPEDIVGCSLQQSILYG